MKFKKVVAIIMAATVLTGALTGCGNEEVSTSSGGGTGSQTSTAEGAERTDVLSIAAYIARTRTVEDYNTNAFILKWEEDMNMDITFDQVFIDDSETTRNLMLSTGDYPEVMFNIILSSAAINAYGSAGVFVDLMPYLDTCMPNVVAAFEKYPEVLEVFSTENGELFTLPTISYSAQLHPAYPRKAFVYEPWLEAVGMEIPVTTEEFKDMLMAFKNEDPNGNGIIDEIPMAGASAGWEADVLGYILSAYAVEGSRAGTETSRLVVVDDVVSYVCLTDEYRDGLVFCNELYEDGLISAESFVQDAASLKAMGENPDAPILGVGTYGWYGGLCIPGGESGRDLDYVALEPLAVSGGSQQTYQTSGYPSVGNFVLTDKCENIEEVLKVVDYLFAEEMTKNIQFGVGNWTTDIEEGVVALTGEQAEWDSDFVYGEEQNLAAIDLPYLLLSEQESTRVVDPTSSEYKNYQETVNKNYVESGVQVDIPPLSFTEEEQIILTQYGLSLVDYINQVDVQFVTGIMDIEKDWEGYLSEISARGADKIVEVVQAAYDRKYK